MDSGFPLISVFFVIVVTYLLSSIKILSQQERGVIFRLGHFSRVRGPGLILVYAPVDRMVRVSLRREASPQAGIGGPFNKNADHAAVGKIGVALTPLVPTGKVFIPDQTWDAVSPVNVPTGEKIVVLRVDGLTLQVEPVPVPKSVLA